MRSYFNSLVIPYVFEKNTNLKCCIFKRKDMAIWQFITGGDEKDESPSDAALREFQEESGLPEHFLEMDQLLKLDSTASVSIDHFPELINNSEKEVYVIPIYSFAYDLTNYTEQLQLSDEHTEFKWATVTEAQQMLHFDLDKTAIWALQKRVIR